MASQEPILGSFGPERTTDRLWPDECASGGALWVLRV